MHKYMHNTLETHAQCTTLTLNEHSRREWDSISHHPQWHYGEWLISKESRFLSPNRIQIIFNSFNFAQIHGTMSLCHLARIDFGTYTIILYKIVIPAIQLQYMAIINSIRYNNVTFYIRPNNWHLSIFGYSTCSKINKGRGFVGTKFWNDNNKSNNTTTTTLNVCIPCLSTTIYM